MKSSTQSNTQVEPSPLCLHGIRPYIESGSDGKELHLLDKELSLCIPHRDLNAHLLVVGKTRSGKTTRVLKPLMYNAIASPDKSVLIYDVTGELREPVARAAAKARKPFVFINFNGEESAGWNPLLGLKNHREVTEIAEIIVGSTESGKYDSPFFRDYRKRALISCIKAVVKKSGDQTTLAHIAEHVACGARKASDWARTIGADVMLELAEEVLATNSNSATTYADLASNLDVFLDPAVAIASSGNDFAFDLFERQPTVVLLCIDEHRIATLRVILQAFLLRFFHFVMGRTENRNTKELKYPIVLFLDEFASSMGPIKDLPVRINTLGKRGLSVIAAVQSLAQIEDVYERNYRAVLAAFGSRISVPPILEADAAEISRSNGYYHAESYTTSMDASAAGMISTYQRPLIDIEDLARAPIHHKYGKRILVELVNRPPFFVHITPCYEHPLTNRFEKKRPAMTRAVDNFIQREIRRTARLAQLPLEKPAMTTDSGVKVATRAILRQIELLKSTPRLAEELRDPVVSTWLTQLEHRCKPQLLLTILENVCVHGITLKAYAKTSRKARSDLPVIVMPLILKPEQHVNTLNTSLVENMNERR